MTTNKNDLPVGSGQVVQSKATGWDSLTTALGGDPTTSQREAWVVQEGWERLVEDVEIEDTLIDWSQPTLFDEHAVSPAYLPLCATCGEQVWHDDKTGQWQHVTVGRS